MSRPQLEAFFLHAPGGYRFCLLHRCTGSRRGSVLFVHAFAEEMNKSRRMAALQSRALAAAGFDVLQIDLLGCGDSSGAFGEATWNDWLADVALGAQALASCSDGPYWIWGQRIGALLACEAVRASARPARLALWHPITAGAQFLNQFLRMKVVSESGGDPGARADTRALRAALARGEPVEVGGYRLSAQLAIGLDRSTLLAPPAGSQVCWFDVVYADGAAPPAASVRTTQAWSAQGLDVTHRTVAGPPFWQTQEITECEALIAQTLQAMCA